MTAAVCSSRRVKRETSSLLPAAGGPVPSAPQFDDYDPGTSGQAVLTWDAPEFLADGITPIGTITSFTIYYGTTRNRQNQVGFAAAQCQRITSISASDRARTIGSITAGLTFFTIAARNGDDSADRESEVSPEVEVTVT